MIVRYIFGDFLESIAIFVNFLKSRLLKSIVIVNIFARFLENIAIFRISIQILQFLDEVLDS